MKLHFIDEPEMDFGTGSHIVSIRPAPGLRVVSSVGDFIAKGEEICNLPG
jgi:hypothetical protein